MSRIGKKAVVVPTGVTANVEGQTVKVKGPKGALQVIVHDDVSVAMDKGSIKLELRSETKRASSSLFGTSSSSWNCHAPSSSSCDTFAIQRPSSTTDRVVRTATCCLSERV